MLGGLDRHYRTPCTFLGLYDKNNIFTFFLVMGVILRMNGLCLVVLVLAIFIGVRC